MQIIKKIVLQLTKNNIEIVGVSTMYRTYKHMKPQVLTVSKVRQGSNDPDKPWSKARFYFMKQLAIYFGKLNPIIVLDPSISNL